MSTLDEYRNKNGRGVTKYHYTVEDIARLSNRAAGTIRNRAKKGKLDLDNLESVIKYIQDRRGDRFNG